MKKTGGNQKGFTLLELLVAVGILAIVTIPLLTAFLVSVRTDQKSKLQMEATTVANNQIESIKASSIERFLQDAGSPSPNEQGQYEIVQTNQSVNHKSLQVKTVIDPNNVAYNEKELSNLYSISPTKDAVYVEDYTLFHEQERKNKRHDIEVKLSQKENGHMEVRLVDSYDLLGDNPREILLFSGESLRNVYLCYYPKTVISSQNPETVFVQNPDNIDCNIYLVCLGYPDKGENHYLRYRYVEKEATEEQKAHVNLCTNLPLAKAGKGITISYIELGDSKQISEIQEKEWLNTTTLAKNRIQVRDLANAQKETWVYQVTIQVYEKGKEGEPLAELTTTMEK